jgi:cell division septal protein FtsQ
LAVNIHASTKYKSGSLLSRQASFQRKRGKITTKKIQGKWKLKIKHIVCAFVLFVGFFYGISRIYLFLISWERLDIKHVEIVCSKDTIQRDTGRYFAGKDLGNILLLNIGQLQDQLASHRWIKSIHIRKIFPSSIKIEINERIPTALLQKDHVYMIDKHGILLEQIASKSRPDLPLFIDKGLFRRDFNQKLALAWKCLETLEVQDREKIAVVDLTEYENVSLRMEDSRTWIKLGNDQFHEKMDLFHKNTFLFEKYGPLEYIDFRCQDRLVLRPLTNVLAENTIDPGKEGY